jgi:hypothetical protein
MWLTAFAAVAAAACASAHDPYEITADVTIDGSRLEIVVTMARSTAMAAATGAKEAPTFEPADFEKLRPKFVACAPRLIEIEVASRDHLTPDGTTVQLTREDDVEFRLSYSLPSAGPLRFDARLLKSLPYAYGVVLKVTREKRELGIKLLSADDSTLEVDASAAPEPSRSS